MSFRDMDTGTAGQFSSAVSVAGTFVRYTFYLFGAIVLGIVGFVLIWLWSNRVTVVEDKPAFRINDGSVARLPVSSDIVTGGKLGRIEVMQYGSLQNRGIDLTVVMALPASGNLRTLSGADLSGTRLLRQWHMQTLSTHYDLDTRYGPLHAVETRIESDGRWRQCLAFNSRFDTNAVLLSGWTCDATGTKPGADALACALDKLVIDKSLASKDADAYLRARMSRPANCSAKQVTQTFDTGSRPISPPSRWSQPSARTRL